MDAVAVELLARGRALPPRLLRQRLGGWPAERLARAVEGLQALGAPLISGAAGIALAQADPLDADLVREILPAEPAVELALARVCRSTNATARQGAGYVLALAEAQTGGRGRRGATWTLPFGAGLALSLGAPAPAGRLDALPLAVAVAGVDALGARGYAGIGLKWPNDLYAHGGKLGGLLVEAYGGAEARIVIGLGLNVNAAPRLSDRSTSALADLGPPPRRSELAGAIAAALLAALAGFAAEGFAAFAERYADLDLLADQPVRVRDGARELQGVARGVDDAGALIIETAAGRIRCTAGEVSLGAWPLV